MYERYDAPLDLSIIPKTRWNSRFQKEMPILKHQTKGIAHFFQRHYGILGEEMGLGKTLRAIIGVELAMSHYEQSSEWFYVAPKSALYSVERDFQTWGAKFKPKLFTYEGLTKEMKNWQASRKAPFGIIFDEFSRCKNANTQRSQAAKGLADGIRDDHQDRGYIIGMTGTPAPKSPADWYSLTEIIQPGFLREGDIHKFKRRLGIIIQKEGIDGG